MSAANYNEVWDWLEQVLIPKLTEDDEEDPDEEEEDPQRGYQTEEESNRISIGYRGYLGWCEREQNCLAVCARKNCCVLCTRDENLFCGAHMGIITEGTIGGEQTACALFM